VKLSIVTTLYQSSPYIEEFHLRSGEIARQLVGDDYEVILVNDGSPDDSLEKAVQLTKNDNHLVVIDLSRNFGHHKAMMTGLTKAKGERVFLIDSDLEEEPEWLLAFAKQMNSKDCDVIYGVQERRKGKLIERLSGKWFYKLFNALTGMKIPENIVTARLMTKRYVEALTNHKEREVFMAGLWQITGFTQYPQTVNKHSSSNSTYTVSRKTTLIVDAITSFSSLPLIGIFYIGVFIFISSIIYILYLVLFWWLSPAPLSGWTSLIASIWFLGGAVISFIGLVGIYLAKIFSEVKQRPYTIIKNIYAKPLVSQ
jgi:putative glycosyltransferase